MILSYFFHSKQMSFSINSLYKYLKIICYRYISRNKSTYIKVIDHFCIFYFMNIFIFYVRFILFIRIDISNTELVILTEISFYDLHNRQTASSLNSFKEWWFFKLNKWLCPVQLCWVVKVDNWLDEVSIAAVH